MITTKLTAEITITGDDDYASDQLETIEENIESGLLDSCGFPDDLQIKVKILDRTVTSQ
jgi:hypothetical protein